MAKVLGHKEELDNLEKRIEEVRRRYDMYFMGSVEQRIPPTAVAGKIAGELRKMREDEVQRWNTGDRFRFQQIFTRLVSLERMWARTMKQIEDGTHKRDKLKIKLRKSHEEEAPPPRTPAARDPLDDMDVDVGSFDDADGDPVAVSSKVPVPAPAPRPAQAPRPAPQPSAAASSSSSAGGGMNEAKLQQLYNVYMQAKKRTGENSNLTIDSLRTQLTSQIPAIKAKHKCNDVDFKVVLKDGKAMLKAVPK